MRILYVLDGLFMGGAERNTLDLMRELSLRGHDTHLCTLADPNQGSLLASAKLDYHKLHSLCIRRIYDLRGVFRFVKLVRRLKPDCIHVQDPHANVLALAARIACNVPAVMTRHVNLGAGTSGWDRLRSYILNTAARFAYSRAILVADALWPVFQDQYRIPADRTVTIHNGIVLGSCRRAERTRLRQKYNWHGDDTVILMVAVLRPGKGHDTLIAAMSTVSSSRKVPGARLVIAGDGPLRSTLERAAAHLEPSVQFLGEREDVIDLMAAADVLVLPSESEAFPTVLLEAAAAGCPVVATAVGGVAEIVEPGITGLIVEPRMPDELASAIVRIVSDPELRNRMSLASRSRAEERFSVSLQAEATLRLYCQSIGGSA